MSPIRDKATDRADVLARLRSLEPQLRARGLRSMHVFGSAARDEVRADSDVDLFVEFAPDAVLGWDFAGAPEMLSRELGRPVDLTTRRALHPLLRADIEREAIPGLLMVRDARHWLFDILDKIAVCERLMDDVSLEALEADVPRRLAVERAIEIISEASRHIDASDLALEPDQPWRQIADIGNRLRHAYHQVPVELIHDVATRSIMTLKPAIERLYERCKRPSDPWPGG